VLFLRRLSGFVLALALGAGNTGVCAGWASTPEARMACCSDGATCPMHRNEAGGNKTVRPITQVQADTCCASAEHENSSQSRPTHVTALPSPVLENGIVLTQKPRLAALDAIWRTAPIPTPSIPKHVLLSVFLV